MVKTVLITGGAGFIASHVAAALLRHGHRVKALDNLDAQIHGTERKPPGYLDRRVELQIGDVRSPKAVRRALSDTDAVVHLAAPYRPAIDISGVDETRPLSFHSPYGCSKGAADQYVLDYARGYSVEAAVFRMSCIYGPHQYGTEDQGWVAHFLISALQDMPITIYGDGKQVWDLLMSTI